MKILFFITILLFSKMTWAQRGGAGHGGGQVSSLPQISASSFLTQAISPLSSNAMNDRSELQQFSFNPLLSVNTNRGSLSTHFQVPLPVNLSLLNSLRFSYLAERIQNNGYGVGFVIEVPKIEKISYQDRRNDFRAIGPLDNSELVETQENLDSLKEKLKKIVSLAFKSEATSFRFYRPIIDEKFNLYVQIKDLGFLALKTDGSSWAFDKSGLPIAFFDSYLNGVSIGWNEGQIHSISSMSNTWKMDFIYGQESLFPQWLSEHFVSPKKSLNKIIYSLPSQGTRTLNFHYTEQYLAKVAWSDGVLPVFTAAYQEVQGDWGDQHNVDALSKDERYVFASDAKEPSKVKTQQDGKIYWYVDLNGDARQDRLVFEQAAFEQSLKSIYSAIEYKTTGGEANCEANPQISSSELLQKVENVIPALSVEMALFDQGNFSYQKDESLSNLMLKPFTVEITLKSEERENCKVKFYSVDLKEKAIHFVDMDGNGRQDIVTCGTKKFDNKNTFAKAIIDSNQEVFKNTGNKAKIYYQGLDHAKYAEKIAQLDRNMQSTYSASLLLDVSKWQESQAHFNCHESSLFIDYNNDGFLDTLTGSRIYLNGAGDSKSIDLDFDELIKSFEIVDSDIDDEASFLVTDIDRDGKIEVIRADQVLSRPESSETLIVSKEQARVLVPATKNKLISSFLAPFGGQVNVAYRYLSGRWIVDKIIHDSKTSGQPIKTIEYEYNGEMHEPYRNLFVGFLKTFEKKHYDHPGMTATTILREFYADLNPAVTLFESRARLNGRLRYEELKETQGQIKYYTTEHDLDAQILPTKRLHPFTRQQTHNLFDETGSYVLNQEITSTSYLDWSNGFLPNAKSVSRGSSWGILSLSSRDSILNYSLKKQIYSYDFANYIHSPMRVEQRDVDDQLIKLEELSYNEFGKISLHRIGERETLYRYDSFGRLISVDSNRNGNITASYHAKTQITQKITQVTGESLINSFDEIWGKANTYEVDQKKYRDSYSSDGVLLKRERQNESSSWNLVYELGTIDFADRTLHQTQQDQQIKVLFDGFGRAINGFYDFADMGIEMGLLTSADGLVLEKAAAKIIGRRGHQVSSKYRYDGLGRRQLKTRVGIERISESTNYMGLCRENVINGVQTLNECFNTDDRKVKENYRGEEFKFQYDGLGNIENVSNVNLNYEHDHFGQLFSSEGKNFERETTTFSTDGRIIDNQYAKQIYDQADRLISHGPKNKEQALTISKHYQKSSLIQEEMTLNSSLVFKYEYDAQNRLSKANLGDQTLAYKYDQYDRVIEEKIGNTALNYSYTKSALTSIYPFVKKIIYLPTQQISRIEFSNGLKLSFFYDEHDRLVARQYNRSGQTLWSQRVKLSPQGLIRKIDDMTISYDEKLRPSLTAPSLRANRNERGEVETLAGHRLHWASENLYSVNGEKNFYSENGSLLASCPAASEFGVTDCFYRYRPDLISVEGQSVKLLSIGGHKLGVLINDQFYPVVENYLGSVVAILNGEGSEILVKRDYSVWGEQVSHTNDEFGAELDRLVVWGFAGLFKNPILEANIEVYWSNSRAYAPKLQQWLSIDPLIKRNPHALLKLPGNWHGERYTNNDPVNFVDPSGHSSMSMNLLSPGDGVKNSGGVSAEAARAFNIENGTHEALDFNDSLRVIGSDYVAPVTELTPANNIIRVTFGVEPLDYFSSINANDRNDALVRELTLGVVGIVGKIATRVFQIGAKGINYFDKIDSAGEVYRVKRNTRY